MIRTQTIIQRIILLIFLTNFADASYSQSSNSDPARSSTKYTNNFLDSLEFTYTKLGESKRIQKIIADCRELGYFHPDEIIHLIDKTIVEVRKKKNARAEIELLFEKNYILADAHSDLEASKKLSYYMLDNLPVTVDEQIQLLDFIARTHLAKSELVEAQNLYKEALELLKKIKTPHSNAHINLYWGVAVTYSESQNYTKSSEYYRKCLEQSRYQKKHYMVSSCFQNLASNALKMHQPKVSKAYLDSAFIAINKIQKKSDRVISEMGLFTAYGDYYKSEHKLDSAVICFKKSLELSEMYNDFYTKSYAMHSLGAVYLELNKLSEAEILLLKSNALFDEKTPSLLRESSRYLYQLYKKKGMFDESLKWHEVYTTFNDSIQKAENVEIIARATTKYEVALKDKTIALLQKEKIVEAQSKEKYKRQWQIIIVLLLLLLVLGAFYLNHNRHQKNKKKIINQVLGEERERTRISMDLHDGVCSQITNISRIVKNSDNIDQATWRTNLANKLDHLNLEVRDISHNLSLIKYDQKTPFLHIVEDYIGDLQESIPIEFTVNSALESESVLFESDRELVLFRVIQEICNNAIKYSQTDTMHFNFTREAETLIISISDQGIGFDASVSGNGIRNIHERVAFLNGKVQLNTNNNGTTFTIQLPLKQTELNQK